MTSIQWTDETWNPVTGCTRVSEGCRNCYIERTPPFRMAGRKVGDAIQLHPERLDQPLHWKKPRRVFVNSLSDLFHEDVPDDFIHQVFAVMALSPQHTFQILTKRPDRMGRLMDDCEDLDQWFWALVEGNAQRIYSELHPETDREDISMGLAVHGPLPNVWLGVSVEDQQTADARIPILLQTPAAVRFVSVEPMLGPVDLTDCIKRGRKMHMRADVEGMIRNRQFDVLQHDDGTPLTKREAEDELFTLLKGGVKFLPVGGACDSFSPVNGCPGHPYPRIDWVIVGGESGPQARPCDVAWIRSIVRQCQAAGVACFVKQLGSKPYAVEGSVEAGEWGAFDAAVAPIDDCGEIHCKDKKGGDPAEWPEDLRVREWPASSGVNAGVTA